METVQLIRDLVIIGSGLFVILGILAALAYVVPVLGGVRRLTDESTRTLVGAQEEVRKLGEALESVKTLTDGINESHRKSIQPALANVEEITDRLNRTVREASYAVEEGVRFTKETVEKATFYRDRVFQPLLEVASIWRGLLAIRRALPGKRSRRK